MMGRLEAGQERLFYHFRLEDQVPANHLLRKLDALLDLDLVRKQLEPFYSEIGRPSVDPELMIRMLLIGYCYSIRSERRLCDEVRFNLAYRWFCGLGLEAAVQKYHGQASRGRWYPKGTFARAGLKAQRSVRHALGAASDHHGQQVSQMLTGPRSWIRPYAAESRLAKDRGQPGDAVSCRLDHQRAANHLVLGVGPGRPR